MTKDKYALRGVSSQKEDVHQAIKHLDKGLFPNSFCKIIPDYLTNDDNYCLISHADGAGTKSSLAYLYWKETGDMSVWKGIAQDAMVMNLDDMLCVGATGPFLVSSTIGRNKHLIPGEVIAEIINGTEAFIASMKPYDINLINCGGETADLGDLVKTSIIDSTFTTRMKRKNIIVPNIKPGQVIIGLASFGQTTYESEYNSGIGSNGLTSARHDVLSKHYQSYTESYSQNTPLEYIYNGSKMLNDPILQTNIGKLLLSPTRTYAPVLKQIIENESIKIDALIHCTGGGQTKVLKFANQCTIVKDNLFEIPPLYQTIIEESHYEKKFLYEVFNMGHRMEIYTDEKYAKQIISICQSFNLDAQEIGRVEPMNNENQKLKIKHDGFAIFW